MFMSHNDQQQGHKHKRNQTSTSGIKSSMFSITNNSLLDTQLFVDDQNNQRTLDLQQTIRLLREEIQQFKARMSQISLEKDQAIITTNQIQREFERVQSQLTESDRIISSHPRMIHSVEQNAQDKMIQCISHIEHLKTQQLFRHSQDLEGQYSADITKQQQFIEGLKKKIKGMEGNNLKLKSQSQQMLEQIGIKTQENKQLILQIDTMTNEKSQYVNVTSLRDLEKQLQSSKNRMKNMEDEFEKQRSKDLQFIQKLQKNEQTKIIEYQGVIREKEELHQIIIDFETKLKIQIQENGKMKVQMNGQVKQFDQHMLEVQQKNKILEQRIQDLDDDQMNQALELNSIKQKIKKEQQQFQSKIQEFDEEVQTIHLSKQEQKDQYDDQIQSTQQEHMKQSSIVNGNLVKQKQLLQKQEERNIQNEFELQNHKIHIEDQNLQFTSQKQKLDQQIKLLQLNLQEAHSQIENLNRNKMKQEEKFTEIEKQLNTELLQIIQLKTQLEDKLKQAKIRINEQDQTVVSNHLVITELEGQLIGLKAQLNSNNSKAESEQSNLEHQIKLLRNKVCILQEEKIPSLQGELNLMKNSLYDKDNTYLSNKQKGEQQIKLQEQQIQQLKEQYQIQMNKLAQEIKDLALDHQYKLDQQEVIAQQLESQNKHQLKNKIKLEEDIQNYKIKADQNQIKMEQQSRKFAQDEEKLRNHSQNQENQIVQSNNTIMKYEIIINGLEVQIQKLQETLKQLELTISELTLNKSDLEDKLKLLQQEYDTMSQEFYDTDNELNNQIDELNDQITLLQQVQVTQQDSDIKFGAEKSTLETEIKLLKNKLSDSELRILHMQEENKKIQDLNHQRNQEIEAWRQQFDNKQVSSKEYEKTKKEADAYKAQFYDLQQEKLDFQSSKSTMERKISLMEGELQSKQGEIASAYELIKKRRSSIESQHKEFDQIKMETYKLTQTIQTQEAEIMLLQEENKTLKRQHTKMKLTIQSQKDTNTRLEEQEISKTQELSKKIEELDNLKTKYQDAWDQMKSQPMGITPSQRLSVVRNNTAQQVDDHHRFKSTSLLERPKSPTNTLIKSARIKEENQDIN